MPTYRLDIEVNGKDNNASSVLNGIGGVLTGLGKAALALTTGGLLALGGILGTATAKAADFGEVMSAVQADLLPTAAEFDALSQKALQLGKDTNFGASEAAVAIDELARNGLNATQVLNGAADATLNLASATGLKGREGLATAATVATDTMANFNIRAEDMARAINGISGVAVVSKFGIDDYRLAMAQAGGVAGSVGVEFEDFNTTIAAISPLFASGSDAGTSFKTMLQRLVPVSGPAAEAMSKLGILAEDGSNRFFDAAGNLKSMAEIAGVLQEAMAGLSEQQAIDLFTEAFGTDAQRAAFALAKTGAEGFEQLAANIAKVDAAAQAATRLDNLSGDIEQLKGSLETAGIELGMAFTPMLRDLTQAATEFINTNLIGRDWSPLISGLSQAASTGLAFVQETLLPGVAAVADFTSALFAAPDALGFLGERITAAGPGILDSFGGWAQAAGAWALEAIPDLLINLLQLRNQAVAWALSELPGWMDALAGWGQALWGWVSTSGVKLLGEFATAQLGLLTAIGDASPGILAKLGEWGNAFVAWVEPQIPVLLTKAGELAGSLWGWIKEQAPVAAGHLGDWAIQFVNWVGPAMGDLIVAAGHAFGDFLGWITSDATLADIDKTLGEWTDQFVNWAINDLGPALVTALGQMAGKVWEEISGLWSEAFAPGSRGEAMLNGIFGGGTTGGSSAGGGWNTGGGTSAAGSFASGVTNFAGGLAYVHAGELLVNMPGGTDVIPAARTASLFSLPPMAGAGGGGGGSFTWNGDLVIQEVSDPQATARAVREELIKLGRRNNGLGGVFGGYG